MDVATLGLKVDASGVVAAARELEKLAAVGDKAEQSAKRVEAAYEESARAVAASQSDAANSVQNWLRRREIQERQAVQASAARERERAAQTVAASEAAGRRAAQANADAAGEVFAREATELHEKVLRGLLKPAEAAKQGHAAGLAYKNALESSLSSARASGGLKGTEGLAVQQDLVNDLAKINAQLAATEGAGHKAGIGINAFREPLTSLTVAATGANPVLGRLAGLVGTFAVGSAITVGALAGIAAIGLAFRVLGKDAREAQERLDAARESARRFAEERNQQQIGGAAVADQIDLNKGRAKLEGELSDLDAALRNSLDETERAFITLRRRSVQKEYDALLIEIKDGEKRLAEERGRGITDGRSGALVQGSAAQSVQIASAAVVEARIRTEQFAKAVREIDPRPFTDVARGLSEITATQERIDALKFAEPYEQGAKAAKEMREEIARLEVRLKALKDAVPENVRRALESPIPRRAAPDLRELVLNNPAPPPRLFTPGKPGAQITVEGQQFTVGGGGLQLGALSSGFRPTESADRGRQITDMANAIADGHRSGIARGFDAARGKLDAVFKSAFSADNLGQAATGLALSFASQAASRLVEGVRGLFGESESERLAKENVAAMERLTASIEEWGNKVAGLATQDILRFTNFAGANQRFAVDERGPRLTGDAERQARDLETFFGFDFGESINPQEWQQLLDAWNKAFDEARRQVQAVRDEENTRRRLVLSGDQGAVGAFDAGRERDAKDRASSDKLSRGLITMDQYFEDLALSADEYNAALRDQARAQEEAARAAEEAQRRADTERNRFVNNILADIARLGGDEAGAKIIERAQILNDAIEQYGESIRPLIESHFAAQDAAEAQAKANNEAADAAQRAADSVREMARAAEEMAALNLDFNVRSKRLSGDERGAFIEEQGAAGRNELRRVEEQLRNQGLSGVDLQVQLFRWGQLIAGEFAKKLAEFDANAAQAAAGAEVVPRASNPADQAQRNAEVATEAMKFATASDSSVVELRHIERSQLAVLRSIEVNTRNQSRGTFGTLAPDFSGSSVAPSGGRTIIVNVHFNGDVTDLDAVREAGKEAGYAAAAAVNTAMGPAFDFAERTAGKNEL